MSRISPVHYIAPSALSVTPNANGSANDLAVYVSRGTKIKVYSPKCDLPMVDAKFQEWTFKGRNRRLSDLTKPYTVYARLEQKDKDNAYLVFAPKVLTDGVWKDKYPYITIDGMAKDTAGADTGKYWYVRLGDVSLPEDGKRTVEIDTGIVGTDQFNTEWNLDPDDMPLRVELACTIDDKDAGPTPYVPWGKTLVLNASLIEGWSGTNVDRFDHWTISRDTGNASADASWPSSERAAAFYNTGVISLYHQRDNDDFMGSVSTTFKVTAWGREDNTPGSPSVVLAIGTIDIMAETVETYELALSDNVVSYNPLTGEYKPSGVIRVSVRASDQKNTVFKLTKEQLSIMQLSLSYAIAGIDRWMPLAFSGDAGSAAVAIIPVTIFLLQRSMNLRLQNASGQELDMKSITFLSGGEDSSVREWIYLRSTDAITFGTASHPLPSAISYGQVNPTGAAGHVSDDKEQDGWVPEGWYDEAQGTDETWHYEYASYRDYIPGDSEDAAGHWGAFSSPSIWDDYSDDASGYRCSWTLDGQEVWQLPADPLGAFLGKLPLTATLMKRSSDGTEQPATATTTVITVVCDGLPYSYTINAQSPQLVVSDSENSGIIPHLSDKSLTGLTVTFTIDGLPLAFSIHVARSGGSVIRYAASTDGVNHPADDGDDDTLPTIPESVITQTTSLLANFSSTVEVPADGTTFNYLARVIHEATCQYNSGTSAYGLPVLYRKSNFPNVLDYYGTDSDATKGFNALAGWLLASVLTEIRPDKRTTLMKTGYNLGPKKTVSPFKYDFKSDQNIARMVASVICSAMRGRLRPSLSAMRTELGAPAFNYSIATVESGSYDTYKSKYYVDLTMFMPTAPGPYLSGYEDRSAIGGVPYDSIDLDDHNLQKDLDIYNTVVSEYNLSNADKKQQVVQAIANIESTVYHLFGDNMTTDHYSFHPAFGIDTIGQRIAIGGATSTAFDKIGHLGSRSRYWLQKDDYYGRRRPGQGDTDGSSKAAPYGVLMNYEIENGDGYGTPYADEASYIAGITASIKADSYPSGHSSRVFAGGLFLIELFPEKADVILKAMNQYATDRQITRYHWLTDTINGRLAGAAIAPVVRASTDYDSLLSAARREHGIGTSSQSSSEPVNLTLSYEIGGYGSCHVDSGEQQIAHYCNKEAATERHPSITVSQTVNFTIEGAGVTDVNGNTSGTWQAGVSYELICPAVADGEEKTAIITMRNSGGVRILYYKLSHNGTHDDGPGEEQTITTTTWKRTIAETNIQPGQYLWTRKRTYYADRRTPMVEYSVSRWGIDGDGIAEIDSYYLATDQQLSITSATDTYPMPGDSGWDSAGAKAKWFDTFDACATANGGVGTMQGWYVWEKTVVHYDLSNAADGSSRTKPDTVNYLCSRIGQDGLIGQEEYYMLAESNDFNTVFGSATPAYSKIGIRWYNQSNPAAENWRLSDTTPNINTDMWSPTMPTYDKTTHGKKIYLWNFEQRASGDGTQYATKPICIGNHARGIQGVIELYALSASQNPVSSSILVPSDINAKNTYGEIPTSGFEDVQVWGDERYDRAPTESLPYQWNWTRTLYSSKDADGKDYEDHYHVSAVKGTAGEDGAGKEFIYCRPQSHNADGTALTVTVPDPNIKKDSGGTTRTAAYIKSHDDFIPYQWTDSPQGIDFTHQIEYQAERKSSSVIGTGGFSAGHEWGLFSTPQPWSKWGKNGQDGDGVEYVFIRTNSNVAPTVNSSAADSASRTYLDDEYLPRAKGGTISSYTECTDDPVGVDANNKFEWVAKRTKGAPNAETGARQWQKYTGTMALWAVYAESITKVSETYRYATNNTGTRPAATSSDWKTTKPTLNMGYWLYTETTITWSDGSKTVLYTDERNPNDGVAGQDIVVDGSTEITYCVSDSNTSQPADSQFKPYSQITLTKGKWLWAKATTYYRKSTSASGSHDAGSSSNYTVSYIPKDGTNGTNGTNGTDGRAITSITEYYKATNSASSYSTAPTSDSGWTTDPNNAGWGESKKYLWNYEKTTYSSGTTVERTIPTVIAIWTKDGKGIDSITNYYLISASSSGVTRNTSGWDDDPIAPTADKPYLWNYEKIHWTDNTDTYTDPQVIGHFGKDGSKGDQGAQGKYEEIKYAISAYKTSTNGSTAPADCTSDSDWSSTAPSATTAKPFVWKRSRIYNPATGTSGSWTYVRLTGDPGGQGSAGHAGRWYDYAGVWGTDVNPQVGVKNTANIGYYVLYYYSGTNKHFYMNTKGDGVVNTTTPANSSGTANDGWEQIQDDREYYIVKAIFGDYAQLGSFIINGDWMISQRGLFTPNASSGSGEGTGSSYYTYFHSSDPLGTGSAGYPCFAPYFAVDGKKGKVYMQQAYVKGQIVATSGQITGDMVVGTYGGTNKSIKLMPSDGKVGAAIKGYNGTTEAFTIGFTQITTSDISPFFELGDSNDFRRGRFRVKLGNSSIILQCVDTSNTEVIINKTVSGVQKKLQIGINASGQVVLAADNINMWPLVGDVGQVYLDSSGYLRVRKT